MTDKQLKGWLMSYFMDIRVRDNTDNFYKVKFPDDFKDMFEKYDIPKRKRNLKTIRRILKQLKKEDYIKCLIERNRIFTISHVYTSFKLYYPNSF